ncbi:MAG: hypothetical protein LBH27_00325 [Endomicrobium sp.]|jgi:outer membrane murein-binding lipoprotein Lpp|nr:hypothetical protein [Endomicrobium sp.]
MRKTMLVSASVFVVAFGLLLSACTNKNEKKNEILSSGDEIVSDQDQDKQDNQDKNSESTDEQHDNDKSE